MRSTKLAIGCIAIIFVFAALGKAENALEATRLGCAIRALRGDFYTLAGDRAALNLFDRLVLGLVLSCPNTRH